jgi:glutaminyl-peptide cyclotransferase
VSSSFDSTAAGCPIHDAVLSRHGWETLNLNRLRRPDAHFSEAEGACPSGAVALRSARLATNPGCPIHDAVLSRHAWETSNLNRLRQPEAHFSEAEGACPLGAVVLRSSLSRLGLFCILLALALSLAAAAQTTDTYQVVHTYPHDSQAFTQGLIYFDGHLYESTGIKGKSSLREEDLDTGSILQFQDVPSKYFAEGLTNWGDTLIQLTWQDHAVLVYDHANLHFLRAMPHPGEGWGITQDGKSLILSDGSATLHFLDPVTLHEVRHITVKDRGAPVKQLNELEFIHGEIYANIWYSDHIARIDPATGKVLGWIDLTSLFPKSERSDPGAVLNGIAWDAAHDRLFVTGKLWPKIYEIKLIPAKSVPPPAPRSK